MVKVVGDGNVGRGEGKGNGNGNRRKRKKERKRQYDSWHVDLLVIFFLSFGGLQPQVCRLWLDKEVPPLTDKHHIGW